MYPIFVFESVVGNFTPNWHGLASMRAANRENPLAHKLRGFKSSLCTCPAVQHLQSVFFQHNILCGTTSERACMQIWQKS